MLNNTLINWTGRVYNGTSDSTRNPTVHTLGLSGVVPYGGNSWCCYPAQAVNVTFQAGIGAGFPAPLERHRTPPQPQLHPRSLPRHPAPRTMPQSYFPRNVWVYDASRAVSASIATTGVVTAYPCPVTVTPATPVPTPTVPMPVPIGTVPIGTPPATARGRVLPIRLHDGRGILLLLGNVFPQPSRREVSVAGCGG